MKYLFNSKSFSHPCSDTLFPLHIVPFQNLIDDFRLFCFFTSHNGLKDIKLLKILNQRMNILNNLLNDIILRLIDLSQVLVILNVRAWIEAVDDLLPPFVDRVPFENLLVQESAQVDWMKLRQLI